MTDAWVPYSSGLWGRVPLPIRAAIARGDRIDCDGGTGDADGSPELRI
jgi:hypothetical protein